MPLHFAGDDELFVGGDNQDLYARVRGADDRFFRLGLGVFFLVEKDAKLIEVSTNGPAEGWPVFASACGEDQRVRAVQLKIKGADPLARLVNQNVQGELRVCVAAHSLRFNV